MWQKIQLQRRYVSAALIGKMGRCSHIEAREIMVTILRKKVSNSFYALELSYFDSNSTAISCQEWDKKNKAALFQIVTWCIICEIV